MPSVVILDVVQRDGLEAPPAKREDEGVSCLQDAVVPAVFLQPHLAHKNTHTYTDLDMHLLFKNAAMTILKMVGASHLIQIPHFMMFSTEVD